MSIHDTWSELQLGQICEFKYGKSLPAASRTTGPYSVYGSNGIVGTHTSALTDGPTIVIGRKGSVGEISYSETSCWPIDTTYFVDSTSTSADLRWLAYRLKDLGLSGLNKAAAVPGLNRDDAYRLRLLVPPLDEQLRVVEVLDRADALRAKRREAIALLDELTQSLFLDMFGDPGINPNDWPIRTIGELIESARYGTSEKADTSGETPVLRMGNITTQGRMDFSDLKYLPNALDDDRYLVHAGDILFNRTNSVDLVGKTAVYREAKPMAYAGYLVRVKTNADNHPEYVSAFLNTAYAKRTLRNMCKSIVGMANINARELQKIRIPAPPFNLQSEFAAQISMIEQFRQQELSGISALDELFASLQQRAFRGEL